MPKFLPHSMEIEKLIKYFHTDIEKGLSARERRKRLKIYGLNRLPHREDISLLSLFISQFKDFMILVLMVATAISALMGHAEDALTIMAIVIINSILGLIQEYRAEHSLHALQDLAAPKARVVEDGEIRIKPANNLVVGDIIFLEVGDKVPADGRLIEASNLQVDEAILSGESLPVEKRAGCIEKQDLQPGDRYNMVFMGTLVTKGKGKILVTSTGLGTEIGRIARLMKNSQQEATPLQKRLQTLGKWLVMGCFLACAGVVILGILQGGSIFQMLLAGVSLAVAAIPEGLPAIITVSLALGVQRMAKRKAIVRKLPAVETLGCTTVICTDKTGTITKSQMQLEEIYINKQFYPADQWKGNRQAVSLPLRIGMLCNSARSASVDGLNLKKNSNFIGDPTEVALLEAGLNAGVNLTQLKKKFPILAEVPFDSGRKRMSVIAGQVGNSGSRFLYIKGAVEEVLKRSSWIWLHGEKKRLTREHEFRILKANEQMANRALRVLAVGYSNLPRALDLNKLSDLSILEKDLVFVGLMGLLDPPRPEVSGAIEKCRQAGIKTIMVTGDHPNTAVAIARKVGLAGENPRVVQGQEMEKMIVEELQGLLAEVNIFSRVSPENKLKIIEALKARGHVVTMTGDGVNDAPALKAADIGVAMGQKGSEVAREAAALVLADDNFSTIVAAAEEGRGIYENIRKFIRYLLSCNMGEIITIFMGMVIGWPLPLLPIQILFVNLVTDGLPALALGLEPTDPDIMQRPPRHPDESILSRGLGLRIFLQGILMGLSTLASFAYGYYHLDAGLEVSRTLAFTTLVLAQLFFVFSCRRETGFIWRIKPWENPYLCFAVFISFFMQMLVLYYPLGNRLFKTVPLEPGYWLLVIICAFWSPVLLSIFRL